MGMLYERFLDDAIRKSVEWLPATQFVECNRTNAGSTIKLRTGQSTTIIKTRYLVGADGATSRVAATLELDRNQEFIVGVEEVLEGVPLEGPPRFHCFLDSTLAPGYLAWAVHDGEQVHVGVGGYAEAFDPIAALKTFRATLKGILDLSEAVLIERRGGRIPVGGVLRRIANSQGLLLGDAAGAVSPLTAGGLDPCMRLSHYAAQVVVSYLRTGNREALSSYSGDLFRARFVSRLWMRRLIATVRSPELIEIGWGLMRLPLLSSFACHVFFGHGSFPDMPFQSTTDQCPAATRAVTAA
jgi:flavin-dependent dehydrogenase